MNSERELITEDTGGRATEQRGGRAILPLPRGGGEGRGEGETAARRHVLVGPLTLTLSPSEGERETIVSLCRPSHGFLCKLKKLHELNRPARSKRFVPHLTYLTFVTHLTLSPTRHD